MLRGSIVGDNPRRYEPSGQFGSTLHRFVGFARIVDSLLLLDISVPTQRAVHDIIGACRRYTTVILLGKR